MHLKEIIGIQLVVSFCSDSKNLLNADFEVKIAFHKDCK